MIRARKKYITGRFLLFGALAGVANGLLGAGGGIIVVAALSRVMGDSFGDKNDIFATALCVMLPLSLLSCSIYLTRGHVALTGLGTIIPPAVVGGAVGGLLLGRLKAAFVKKMFSALVILSGILLIVR